MRSRFDESNDKAGQTPDDTPRDSLGRPLRCSARDCPMRWSVDVGHGLLCHWHDNAEPRDWPAVTRELQDMRHRGVQPVYRQMRQSPLVAKDVARLKAFRARKAGDLQPETECPHNAVASVQPDTRSGGKGDGADALPQARSDDPTG